MDLLKRWPPIVWPAVTIASLLILVGSSGGWRPPLLIAGGALALCVFVLALRLAIRDDERPKPPAVYRAIAGLVAFYLLVAAAASLAGAEYGVAALAAGVIPLTALSLMLATARTKMAEGDSHRDPFPGIEMDHETPLGDTPEHSEAIDP